MSKLKSDTSGMVDVAEDLLEDVETAPVPRKLEKQSFGDRLRAARERLKQSSG